MVIGRLVSMRLKSGVEHKKCPSHSFITQHFLYVMYCDSMGPFAFANICLLYIKYISMHELHKLHFSVQYAFTYDRTAIKNTYILVQ
jgi:hypothetical protein